MTKVLAFIEANMSSAHVHPGEPSAERFTELRVRKWSPS